MKNQETLLALRSAIKELVRDYHVKSDAGFEDALLKSINTIALQGAINQS